MIARVFHKRWKERDKIERGSMVRKRKEKGGNSGRGGWAEESQGRRKTRLEMEWEKK